MKRLFCVAAGILFTVGCGGGNTYHCDFRTSENPEDRCQERSNNLPGGGAVPAEAFKNTCEAVQGDGGDGPCGLDGAVLGCKFPSAGAEEVIDWYYSPKTRADAEMDCENDDGTFIEP